MMEFFLENLFSTYSNFDYSVLFYLTAFLSVSVVAISKSGFGGGLGGLGVPIMLFILPAKIVLAVFLPLIVLMDLWVIYVWRRFPIYKIILIMCLGGFIGQIAGWYFFKYLDDQTILFIIASLAIITSLRYFKNLYKKKVTNKTKVKVNYKKGVAWSSLSGFSSFIALSGAIPAHIFLLPLKLKRENFVSIMSFYFFFVNFTKIPFFWELDIFTMETIAITILLIPIIPIGIFFGKWLNSKLSDKIFYHVTHIALFLCGINLFIKGYF